MNYIDRYGLYNVKPVKVDEMPTGNDGWILTAYASKLGFPVDMIKNLQCYRNLPFRPLSRVPVRRLPEKETPFVSRDVVLGWYWLGYITAQDLIINDWNFSPFQTEGFKLIETVKQFWDLRDKDRNYFWKNEYKQVYRFAFMVPLQDRAYILRDSGLPVPLAYSLVEKASRKLSKEGDSSRLIAWAKGYEKPDPEVFTRYFGLLHPFTQKVKELNTKGTQYDFKAV